MRRSNQFHRLLKAGVFSRREYTMQDPDAIAYATARSLPAPQAEALDRAILAIKGEGFGIAQLFALRSEFNARDGSTYHAVIGNNGTVTGSVSNNATGAGFVTGSYIEFSNPIKSAALTDFAVLASASMPVVPTDATTIVSGFAGTSARGISVGVAAVPGIAYTATDLAQRASCASFYQVANSQTPASTRRSALPQFAPIDNKTIIGAIFVGGACMSISGGYTESGVANLVSVWNDGENMRIGQLVAAATNTLASEVDFVVILNDTAGYNATTGQAREVSSLIAGPATSYGLAVPTRKIALSAIGDSMSTVERSARIAAQHTSGWQGAHTNNNSLGGQPLSIVRGFFETEKRRLLRFAAHSKYMMFWGGYNLAADGYTFDTPEGRAAYLAELMEWSAELADAGIQSVHWTSLAGRTATPTDMANSAAYNDALVAACNAAGYMVYDHRLTFSNNEFDGPTSNASYFIDSLHLSSTGIEVITADFATRLPNPVNPFE